MVTRVLRSKLHNQLTRLKLAFLRRLNFWKIQKLKKVESRTNGVGYLLLNLQGNLQKLGTFQKVNKLSFSRRTQLAGIVSQFCVQSTNRYMTVSWSLQSCSLNTVNNSIFLSNNSIEPYLACHEVEKNCFYVWDLERVIYRLRKFLSKTVANRSGLWIRDMTDLQVYIAV